MKNEGLCCLFVVGLCIILSAELRAGEPSLNVAKSNVPVVGLKGKLDGINWECKNVYMAAMQPSTGEKYLVELFDHEVNGKFARLSKPHLIVTVPKKSGTYDSISGVTFFIPPAENNISINTKMRVERIGTTVFVVVVASYNEKNAVSGSFSFKE